MSDDVLEEMHSWNTKKAINRRDKANDDYLLAWRRLLAFRDGLTKEIEDRLQDSHLEEDWKKILKRMQDNYAQEVERQKRQLDEISLQIERHRLSSFYVRIGAAWKKELEALLAREKKIRSMYDFALTTHQSKDGQLYRNAVREAKNAREMNWRHRKPLLPLIDKRDRLNVAIAAIEAKDPIVIDCLKRWDIDAMINVASIWDRMQKEYISAGDWHTYQTYGRERMTIDDYGMPVISTIRYGNGVNAISDVEDKSDKVMESGEFIQIIVKYDDSLVGSLTRKYHNLPNGLNLGTLSRKDLVDLLQNFNLDALQRDADLLEAYLDALHPDWRDDMEESMSGENEAPMVQAPEPESPYDVLGVTREMPMGEIAEAFRMTMLAIQHLPNQAPQRRLIDAYKKIKKEKANG